MSHQQTVNLEPILKVGLLPKLGQLSTYPVRLGNDDPPAILATYSANRNIDPWCEAFFYPTDTFKFALITQQGEILWTKDLGPNVVPGVAFCPVYAFDLDGDGIDEIWYVDNIDDEHPLSLKGRRLARVDATTGETTGHWIWPSYSGDSESLSHSNRNFIFGGYANGEPVLVSGQGIYGPIFLQGWKPDMSERWDVRIAKDDPGARGSHPTVPVLDINNDGIDEVLWGERCIGLDTGVELFCADRDVYNGHSDVIQPFRNPETGETCIFTVREGDPKASPRVVTYDNQGNRVWGRVDEGHMDMGWVGRLGENGAPIAAAIKIGSKRFTSEGVLRGGTEEFVFDAITGEDRTLPFSPFGTKVKDINGDGYDEVFSGSDVRDRHGNIIGSFEGRGRRFVDLPNHPGLQISTSSEEGEMMIWTDRAAVSSQ